VKNKTVTEETKQAEGTIDGPGSQLRKARERQGLEQAKVAAQLHLSQALIQALEWDDYEKLPSAVFVQGYLRNYARLLGVDEDAVISAYQELNPRADQAPLPRNQPDNVARELHGDHRLIRFMTWGVVVVLGVMLFFWWQGRMSLPGPEPAPTAEESGSMAPTEILPTPMESIPEPSASAQEAAPPPSELAESPQPTVVEPPQEEPPVEPDMTGSVTPAEAPPAEAPPAEIPSEPVQPAETAPVASAEQPAAPMPAGSVVFEFTGPCWVEVRDPTGRARIIGEMHEGVRKVLDAQLGPFEVVLGDINAVRLTVNGQAYDLKRRTRGKVARFTLDPSQF
jgi:cytoskeleton protein RodZ